MLPCEKELREAGIYINCPDCGEFLWEAGESETCGMGCYREDCPNCGWPAPDEIVGPK